MKKLVYVVMGLLLITPVVAMAQTQRSYKGKQPVELTPYDTREIDSLSRNIEFEIEKAAALRTQAMSNHYSIKYVANDMMIKKPFSLNEKAVFSIILKENRALDEAYQNVLSKTIHNQPVSFEDMDALGKSFNSFKKFEDTEITKEYKKLVLSLADGQFYYSTGKTLADLANEVQWNSPDKELTHLEIFQMMDGTHCKNNLLQ